MLHVTLILFACTLVFSIEMQKPVYNIDHANYYFNDFVKTYNKQYANEKEKEDRLKVFTENLKKFNKMNREDSAMYGINQFADLTTEEFLSTYTGLDTTLEGAACKDVSATDMVTRAAPDAFDWRDKNMVTPVKDQGRCGSCYTFSTTGNIESQYAIKNNGEFLDLSEQQLVDCSKINLKCDGGYMTQCMMDIIDAGGLASEEDYPYTGAAGSCRFQPNMAKITLSGCNHYTTSDENELKEILYNVGPIAIGVAADAVQSYTGGIIESCPGEVDHAVLLVGYGSENGKDFWIIKNSWGATYGENGYFRILRGQNTCSIMNDLISSAVLA